MHNAACHGHLDVVKLLFESGADLDVRNSDDETPSEVASANRKWEVAKFLVECLGVDSWDDWIVARSDSGSPKAPSVVLPALDRVEHVGSPDDQLISMHVACVGSDPDVIQSLLGRGTGVNERDDKHETPLIVASRSGNLEVAKLLLKTSADVTSRDKYGWTPLHYASREGHLDIVRILLDDGANVNAKHMGDWTPLHLASWGGHIKIVQLLLERGANVETRNYRGRTPSDIAAGRGEFKIVGLLSQSGTR